MGSDGNYKYDILKGKKFLILGHGRHGKDEVARILQEKIGNRFISSSLFALRRFVRQELQDKYGMAYDTEELCYADRLNHREHWYEIIEEYCAHDKSLLARGILEENDMYVGMRSSEEYVASRHLFDYIIYISAYPRVDSVDPTMKIGFDPTCMHYIANTGTIADLEDSVRGLLSTFIAEGLEGDPYQRKADQLGVTRDQAKKMHYGSLYGASR